MSDVGSISGDRERVLQHFIERKFAEIAAEAVECMRAMPGRLLGDDSGLADVFEEYGCQLVEEESFAFNLYESEAFRLCAAIVDKLTQTIRSERMT